MSKRFTDTALWNKEWFMKLSPKEKCAFNFIKDNCDSVGIWSVNKILAEMMIGDKIEWEGLVENSKGNIVIINDSKWWLIDFCDFQYGELDECSTSKPIQSYIKLLKKHNLYDKYIEYSKGIHTLQEKEKDKEKEKEKEKDKEAIEEIYKTYPTRDIIQTFSTGKCQKNREQIKKLLKTKSKEDIIKTINLYIAERKKVKLSIKTFGNFLDNFPDINDFEIKNDQNKNDWSINNAK